MSCESLGNKLNLVVQQGATFTQQITLKASDGSSIPDIIDADLRGQIRTTYDAASVTASFSFNWVDHAEGIANMVIEANVTNLMSAGNYVYDVELFWTVEGTVWRILEGKLKVTPEVTK